MNDRSLDQRSRPDLIQEARAHGVERPERMTRAELRDEILRRTKSGDDLTEARGFFGVARSMIASVVESGLNLPDAAAMIRGNATFDARVGAQPPVATVTLAEIYAAQGHKKRALRMLDDVLDLEPDHEVALRLRREMTLDETPREPTLRESTTRPEVRLPSVVAPLVETMGEEIQTGKPPVVEEVVAAPSSEPAVQDAAEQEAAVNGEAVQEPPVSRPPFLALGRASTGLGLYWELSQDVLGRAGIDVSEGHLALKVVTFAPHGAAPRRNERTLRLDANWAEQSHGRLFLSDVAVDEPVRAAVGFQLSDVFVPLAVGREVKAPDDDAPASVPDVEAWQRARAALFD